MSRVTKIGVVVLVLLAIAVSTASAQNVTRSFDPDPVKPGQTVNVTLSVVNNPAGSQIIETIPSGFTYISYTYSGADNVNFQQSGNTLTFTVTDVTTGPGYIITYTLQAPTTEGTYTFTGTYTPIGGNPENIAGDSVLSVSNVTKRVPPQPIVNITLSSGGNAPASALTVNEGSSITAYVNVSGATTLTRIEFVVYYNKDLLTLNWVSDTVNTNVGDGWVAFAGDYANSPQNYGVDTNILTLNFDVDGIDTCQVSTNIGIALNVLEDNYADRTTQTLIYNATLTIRKVETPQPRVWLTVNDSYVNPGQHVLVELWAQDLGNISGFSGRVLIDSNINWVGSVQYYGTPIEALLSQDANGDWILVFNESFSSVNTNLGTYCFVAGSGPVKLLSFVVDSSNLGSWPISVTTWKYNNTFTWTQGPVNAESALVNVTGQQLNVVMGPCAGGACTAKPGDTFSYTIQIVSADNGNFTVTVAYNTTLLEVSSVTTPLGVTVAQGAGWLQLSGYYGNEGNWMQIATINFHTLQEGSGSINITSADIDGNTFERGVPSSTPITVGYMEYYSGMTCPPTSVLDFRRDVTIGTGTVDILAPGFGQYQVTFRNVEIWCGNPTFLRYSYVEGGQVVVDVSPRTSDSTTVILTITNAYTGNSKTYTFYGTSTISIPFEDLGPGFYNFTFDIRDPNYGNVVADLFASTGYLVSFYKASELFPEINIDVDSATGNTVTEGDAIFFSVDFNNLPATANSATWVILGPSDFMVTESMYRAFQPVPGLSLTTRTTVPILTSTLINDFGAHPGQYKFVVLVRDCYGDTITLDSVLFTIQSIDLSLVSPASAKIGQKVPVYGTTNVANTGDVYDAGVPNQARITIYGPGDYMSCSQRLVGNSCEYYYCDACVAGGDYSYAQQIGYVLLDVEVPIKDGEFWIPSKVLTIHPTWPSGSYRVHVTVTTEAGISEDDWFYFTVNEPDVSFNLDTYTYIRGEGVKIKGETSFVSEWGRAAVLVYSDPVDLDQIFELSDLQKHNITTVNGHMAIVLPIEANTGKFTSETLHIRSDASKRSYTLYGIVAWTTTPGAAIPGPRTWYVTDFTAVTSIRVVKETFKVTVDPNVVTRGQEFKLSGEGLRLDTVYLFADRDGLIDGVPKIPSDDQPFTAADVGGTLYPIDVKDGKFSTILKVRNSRAIIPDTYLLYLIQPSDRTGNNFDPTQDPLAIVALTVVEFAIEDVRPVNLGVVKMVRGDSIDLFVKVNGDPDLVQAFVGIKGKGINVPYTNMPFVKYNETGSGWLFTTLYPFYDEQHATLVDSFDNANNEPLVQGIYNMTIYLFHQGTQVDERKLTFEVVDLDWDIKTYAERDGKWVETTTFTQGEDLIVYIDTNRKAKGYDDIHVVFDQGSDRYKFLFNPLNETGDTVVRIPTAGIQPGTYKIYIRDGMRTWYDLNQQWDWDVHFNYDPVKEYYACKDFYAQDDGFNVIEVKITKAGAPTATTTTPAPTATTTTAAVTTTTTTPAPTATTTTAAVTTTTPTEGGGIPGFEAVFAIAGLLAVAYLLRRR